MYICTLNSTNKHMLAYHIQVRKWQKEARRSHKLLSNFAAVDSWTKNPFGYSSKEIKYDSTEYRWLFSTALFFEINILSHSSHLNFQPFQRHGTRTKIENIKVHIFWEGHKILRNLRRRFFLCSNGQIYRGHFANFCDLLKIYEL